MAAIEFFLLQRPGVSNSGAWFMAIYYERDLSRAKQEEKAMAN